MDGASLKKLVMTSPPVFHYWNDAPQTGGFRDIDFEEFDQIIAEYRKSVGADVPLSVAETGAGLSTLWFLANNCLVHAFSLSDVTDKVSAFLRQNFPRYEEFLTISAGESERRLVSDLEGYTCDIALIDGNHSIPTVFSDFVGFNLCLKQNGILIIDDIQLPGPDLLMQMLNQLPDEWEFINISRSWKWVYFRKLTNDSVITNNMDAMTFSRRYATGTSPTRPDAMTTGDESTRPDLPAEDGRMMGVPSPEPGDDHGLHDQFRERIQATMLELQALSAEVELHRRRRRQGSISHGFKMLWKGISRRLTGSPNTLVPRRRPVGAP